MGAFRNVLKALGTNTKAIGTLYRGVTIAQYKGMSNKLLEGIYTLGHQHYKQQNFKLASKIFRYLCIHDHLESRFMAALGACEYHNGDYQSAQYVLENALSLNNNQPSAYLNLALSYIAQKKKAEAVEVLSKIISVTQDDMLHKKEHQSAQYLLSQYQEKEI